MLSDIDVGPSISRFAEQTTQSGGYEASADLPNVPASLVRELGLTQDCRLTHTLAGIQLSVNCGPRVSLNILSLELIIGAFWSGGERVLES
jgi:hypothetical protein